MGATPSLEPGVSRRLQSSKGCAARSEQFDGASTFGASQPLPGLSRRRATPTLVWERAQQLWSGSEVARRKYMEPST